MASGSAKREAPLDRIALRVKQELEGVKLTPSSRIFKVPKQLRQINEQAYEPEVISIGPYHHGKDHLKAMEVHKLRNLKLVLDRDSERTVEAYVTALTEMEEKARNCYSEPLDHISAENFVEMMLLDGFFIIGLALSTRSVVDDFVIPFFPWEKVRRDLLLVENQLPLIVLSKLCSLFPLDPGNVRSFDMILDISVKMMASPLIKGGVMYVRITESNKHLLDSLHDNLCSSRQSQRTMSQWQFIGSATELKEAGIKFQKNSGVLFDIKFQNGVISIPALTIDDCIESILRNLVAYERYNEGNEGVSSTCFTDYITFMDCLINTGKDVELLCGVGVLENRLCDYEVVATMFNRLGDSVLISEEDFLYSEIFIRVNKHCNRECDKQMAILRHHDFKNPGALISCTSAIFLFLCALLQALFTILSYHHQTR